PDGRHPLPLADGGARDRPAAARAHRPHGRRHGDGARAPRAAAARGAVPSGVGADRERAPDAGPLPGAVRRPRRHRARRRAQAPDDGGLTAAGSGPGAAPTIPSSNGRWGATAGKTHPNSAATIAASRSTVSTIRTQ